MNRAVNIFLQKMKKGVYILVIWVYTYINLKVATQVNNHRGHDTASGFGGESQIATRTDDEALKGERNELQNNSHRRS